MVMVLVFGMVVLVRRGGDDIEGREKAIFGKAFLFLLHSGGKALLKRSVYLILRFQIYFLTEFLF